MRLSHEKAVALSHLVVKSLQDLQGVRVLEEANDVRLRALRAIEMYLKTDQAIENYVRHKIATMRRQVIEGTQEWEVLHDKFYREEIEKQRKVRG